MRIMITGGGTGGHVSPAVAILEELQRRDPRLIVQWVGRRGGIEEGVCQNLAVPFRALPVEGWPRGKSLRRVWTAMKLGVSIAQSAVYLRQFRPQLVLGVGGYVSLPLMYAAQRINAPTVIHEQNRLLGMANRLLAPRARRIFLSYPVTIGPYPKDRAVIAGNPVRAGFISPPSRTEARAALNLANDIPVLLICGGSQGAHSINAAVAEALPLFPDGSVQVLWMTGKADLAMARAAASTAAVRVEVFAYIQEMPRACAAADLLAGRAGASSTAEVAVLGKPSILIPFPHAADNHQEQNARAFEEAGASVLLLDKDLTGKRLYETVQRLLADPAALGAMGEAARRLAKPYAAETIAEEILAIVFGQARAMEREAAPNDAP